MTSGIRLQGRWRSPESSGARKRVTAIVQKDKSGKWTCERAQLESGQQ